MNKEQLKILEQLPQYPANGDKGELRIGKNNPKDMGNDYWWCSYGKIWLSGYYSLPQLLADLADWCLKYGYAVQEENALLNQNGGNNEQG